MKVADLALRLQQLPPDADVMAFDPDTGRPKPVTSYVVSGRKVVLCTDVLQLTCPAAGMKTDACSDRSQCLEACGPHGQAPKFAAAVATLHAPNGVLHACEQHASTARLQASFFGTHAYVDEPAPGTPCTYCAARGM